VHQSNFSNDLFWEIKIYIALFGIVVKCYKLGLGVKVIRGENG